MRLFFIDTHETGHFSFGWLRPDAVQRTLSGGGSARRAGENARVWDYEGRTGNFFYQITKHVKLDQLKKADCICVVKGPGSFSSIRAGVLVANLLARALKLKLYSLPAGQDKISDADFKHMKPQVFVAPEYDREPNITFKAESA